MLRDERLIQHDCSLIEQQKVAFEAYITYGLVRVYDFIHCASTPLLGNAVVSHRAKQALAAKYAVQLQYIIQYNYNIQYKV